MKKLLGGRLAVGLVFVVACGSDSHSNAGSGAGDAGHGGDATTGGGGDDGGGGGDAGPVFVVNGTDTSVIALGAFPAGQAAAGLGWNLSMDDEFEFKAAHDAGATRGRVQCGWAGVEIQSAPPANTSGQYTLPTNCQNALAWAKKYDLALTFVAAFGPPYHQILTVDVTAAAPAGATEISVQYASGMGGDTLAALKVPYDYVFDMTPQAPPLSARHSYEGTLISGVKLVDSTHATLTLASALTTGRALAAGASLGINEILYPSAASYAANDPSVIAYAHYVEYLGSQCALAGVSCDIELWNEPPWGGDCWDNRADCYDGDAGLNEVVNLCNYGFAAALQTTTPPAGVTYTWGGTNKSGGATLLGSHFQMYSGAAYQEPDNPITSESFHPYGSNPEDAVWNEPCLVKNLAGGANAYLVQCNLQPSGSNEISGVAATLDARLTNPSYGIGHSITETGISADDGVDFAHEARFVLRQYLGFMADGISPIEFYRFYQRLPDGGVPTVNGGETSWSYVLPAPTPLPDGGTDALAYTALPNYTALAGLIGDVTAIKGVPATPYAADGTGLTTVASYSGTYPLAVMHLVGTRAGDTANSEMVVLYQLSSSTTKCGTVPDAGDPPCWQYLASPPDTATTLTVPADLTIASAVNLSTRAIAPYRQTGQMVTVNVSDDPVALLLVPGE